MGTYRVYNENYSSWGTEDLSSIDFVEVDNAVLNCVKDDNNLYSPSIKKLLNIVNVKVQDIPTFVKRNIILSPQQVVQCATGNDTDYTDGANYMHPNQFKYKQMMEELKDEELLDKEDSMTACDYNDRFFEMLQEAEKYCPTAVNANKRYEKRIKEALNAVPKYKGASNIDREIIDAGAPTPRRICGYQAAADYVHGANVTANDTIPVSAAWMANENYCDNSQYLTSGICMAPSVFDDKPRDIQIDADSIFTSQPKPDIVDNSDLLNISSDTSTLMQGSCLDLFNDNSEKFEDFKIREPEHTSPAKLEKQRRIEEYHKRHNRKRNR
jgi:hypothetical protein